MPKIEANNVEIYYELHGPEGADVLVLSNGVFMSTASWIFQTPVLYVAGIAVMLSLDARLTFWALLPFPLFILVARLFSPRMFRANVDGQEQLGKVSTAVQENASGVMVVRTYGLEDHERRRFEEHNRELYRRMLRVGLISTAMFTSVGLLPATASAQTGGRWQGLENQPNCAVWNAAPRPEESVHWSGACRDGQAHGEGVLTWHYKKDGKDQTSVFRGTLKDGKGHGPAVFETADGNRYEGMFTDGLQSGRGVLAYANGDRYEGDFVNGVRTGKGAYRWADGTHYTGDFQNNRMHGQGVYTKPDGLRYEGALRRGKFHGKGTYSNAEGTYSGAFVEGSWTGKGTWTGKDGSLYDGDFRDDRFHGHGILKDKGTVYEGGLRVPAVIEWPARIPKPRVTQYPAGKVDIFPTLAEVAGLPESVLLEPQDGVSLAHLFKKDFASRKKPLGFRHKGRAAWIDNDWKLVTQDVAKGKYELYNLASDRNEAADLAEDKPETLARMVKAFEKCIIQQSLADNNGNIQATIETLGIPRRTLNEKMRKYGLDRKDYV